MAVEVGLHHTLPPSGYTICENWGTSTNRSHRAALPADAFPDFGIAVEQATATFLTLGVETLSTLNRRSLSWKVWVSLSVEAMNVSVEIDPSVSFCPLTEWRAMVD